MQGAAGSEIVGRASELAAVTEFVGALEQDARCLVLEGAAGVGKTTLWRAAIGAARERGVRVLETRPVQAEASLAFTGLGDLFGAVPGGVVERLPAPQAEALEVALMLRRPGAVPPEGRAVALATLGALRVLAEDGPVLVAVDDVQWLDTSSASVLGFAWRRLRGEPVGVVAGWRVGESAPELIAEDERTRRLEVRPLSVGAMHAMLRSHFGSALPRPMLLRLHEVAGGNAFYALELCRALAEREVVPAAGEPLPVPRRLRDLMYARLAALPEPSRDAMAATAALLAPTLRLVGAEFGGEEALRPALQSQVLGVEGDRLVFAHPLLAAAAYEQLDAISRRELHRRLARIVEDQEQRARHLALAADGPDPEVADALEQAALHARSRGATDAAADLSDLAFQLTPPDAGDDGARRLLLAGRLRWLGGDTPGAVRHIEKVIGDAPSGALRADALTTLAWVFQMEGDQLRAAELARAALAEPDIDDERRAEAARRLAATLLFMREDLEGGVRHAALAAEIAGRSRDPAALAPKLGVLLDLQTMVGSPDAPTTEQRLSDVIDAVDWSGGIGSANYDRANVAMWTDRHEEAATMLCEIQEQAALAGEEGAIPHVLAQLALADYLAGRWTEAARRAEAGWEAAVQAGQRLSQAWTRSTRALVRASLGRESEARADAAEALALAGERGMGVARIQSVWALGLLALPLGHPERAVEVLAPVRRQLLDAGVGEPGAARFIPDEIEALIALGRTDEAIAVLEWLRERASSLDRASALAAAGRCSGLVVAQQGDTGGAVVAFERALEQHARVRMPFERARTLLALGTVQRRAKQRAAARATLDEALRVFDQLGATLWAAKARGESARIGGRTARGSRLTATEQRTAELVALGLSNKQAAAALFVTPRTVETQLTRIYAKLEVHSRTELARRLHDAAEL